MTKKKILLADDEPPVRRVLTMSLERQGYEVKAVTNGQEALDSIDLYQPDLLLTDISMPKMTGRELCQNIKENYPGRKFRIIVMTANVGRDEREWVAELKNIVFMEKPISPRLLISMVADYFTEEVP